jgi:hypothetical protein
LSLAAFSESGAGEDKLGQILKPVAEAVDALVAESTARRARRDYAGSAGALLDALRIDPDNAAVMLLLAGQYEERGMLDEALIWYRSAQRAAPDSEAAAAGIRGITSGLTLAPQRSQSAARGANVKLWVSLAAAILVFVVLAVLIRNARNTPRTVAGKELSIPTPPTAVIPAVPRVSPPTQPTPRSSRSSGYSGGTAAPARPSSAQARTAPEKAIRERLEQTHGYWPPQLRIDDVVADPRYAAVTVTFSMPRSALITKANLVQNAFFIAAAAFTAHNEVQVVTIRCAVPGDNNSYQIAFVGDILRQTALAYSGGVTPEQMNASFTSVWWNPRISQ